MLSSPIKIAETSRSVALLAASIALLALAVRVWNLHGQSITIDELFELDLATKSLPDIIQAKDGFPPLYQLLLKGWIAVFGPATARELSIVFGLMILPPIWWIGKMIAGHSVAWTAVALTAISPLNVWYAQDGRANALFYLLAITSVAFFIKAMTTTPTASRHWLGYVAISALGLYTHYYFALVVAGLFATAPLYADFRSKLPSLLLVGIALLFAIAPWIWLLPPDLNLQTGYLAEAPVLDLKSLAYTLVTFIFGFSVGPSLADLHVLRSGRVLLEGLPWGIAAVSACILALWPLRRDAASIRWVMRLAITVVVPIALCGIAASSLDLGYRVRYLGWGASLLIIALSLGIVRGQSSLASAAAVGIIVCGSLISLANRNFNDRYANEDSRSAAAYLAANHTASRPVFVMSDYMAPTISYYLKGEPQLLRVPGMAPTDTPAAALNVIRGQIAAGQPFLLVYSRPWDGDPGGQVKQGLETAAGLKLEAEWSGIQLYAGRGW
ncbi:MAG: glycosyltransferase family 39 protein [Hyphomicrobiaceae bacterium]|nr:glycosyltransferase family 39 protein [Hyphomicrobiaceae bacterium]